MVGCGVLVGLLGVAPVHAQFSSGSTGSLGALAPVSNTVVTLPADGILNYTTVTIPSGVTVTFQRNTDNTPVTLLAQGAVSIAGTITVSGQPSVMGSSPGASRTAGGLGGPGGFSGGLGGIAGTINTMGGPGQGVRGGNPGLYGNHVTGDGAYGAETGFVTLIPLFGGSGGGGGSGPSSTSGMSGAGGGGALVLASTTQVTIQSTGQILANGGTGQLDPPGNCNWYAAGAGSGGAIRLVAPTITVTTANTVQAVGGALRGRAGWRLACLHTAGGESGQDPDRMHDLYAASDDAGGIREQYARAGGAGEYAAAREPADIDHQRGRWALGSSDAVRQLHDG